MKGDYKKIFLQSYYDFTLTHNSTSEMPALVKKAEPPKMLVLISPHAELNFEMRNRERWLSFKCLNSVQRFWMTIKSWSSKSMFPPPDPSLFVPPSPPTLDTLGCRVLTPLVIKRKGKQVQISKQANKVTEQSLLTALHIIAKDPAGKYWETLSISHWFLVHWSHSQKNSYFSLPSLCSPLYKGILQGKKNHIEIPPPQILSLGILLSPSQRKGICSIANISKCNLLFHEIPCHPLTV